MLLCDTMHSTEELVDPSNILQETSWKDDPFLSIDKLATSWILLSSSNFLLKFSLKNSTVMNVRAEAGIYHVILGMLPLNIPLAPSANHILRTASNHPLYLRVRWTINWVIDDVRDLARNARKIKRTDLHKSNSIHIWLKLILVYEVTRLHWYLQINLSSRAYILTKMLVSL